MGNLTLKTTGIFLVFWLVWIAPAVVSAYALMNNTAEQIDFIIQINLIIWFVLAGAGVTIVISLVKPIEKNYEKMKGLSNDELIKTSKKTLNIYYVISIVYAFIWLVGILIMFYVFKLEYGNLASYSIWVGGLSGFLAVPFMLFSVLPLVFSKTNRAFSAELNNRNLTVKGTYISILKKNISVALFSIFGITVWIGTFGFYTGVNQMIEEVKQSRYDKLDLIIQNINRQYDTTSYSKNDLINEINKITIPDNELILIADNNFKISDETKIINLFEEKNKNISELVLKIKDNLKLNKLYDNVNDNVYTYKQINNNYVLILFTNIDKNIVRLTAFWYWLAVFIFIGFTVAITNMVALPVWMSKTINNLREIFEKLTKNDFSENATKDSEDELGIISEQYNIFVIQIRKLLASLQNTSVGVFNAGSQLSAISEQLAQGANEQATTTEEVATSMEEILATINSNTKMANNTSKMSSKSAKQMKQSNELIMNSLNSILEISDKITIISEIAEKTDILSINAAIEAARAGESGKGFAVVAKEIRKLADNTKIASIKINELSKNGQEISNIATQKLEKIIPKIIKSAMLVSKIVTASKEQQSGAQSINISIQQLTEIANTNSASAEEMATSAEELSSQAEQLRNLISIFKINNSEDKEQTPENIYESKISNPPQQISTTGIKINMSDNDTIDNAYHQF